MNDLNTTLEQMTREELGKVRGLIEGIEKDYNKLADNLLDMGIQPKAFKIMLEEELINMLK